MNAIIPEINEPILTIGDKNFRVADLPADIQQLLRIYKKCEQDLSDKRDVLFLTEISLKTLSVEVEMRMKKFQENSANAS